MSFRDPAPPYTSGVRTALALVLASFGLVACHTTRRHTPSYPCVAPVINLQSVPGLGERLRNVGQSCTSTFAASAQTWPSYEAVVAGVKFTIGVDDENVVRFVATNDPMFTSPEGLHVRDAVAAAVAASPAESIRQERGWGYFIRLPSGWYAFIDDSRLDASGRVDLNLGTRPLRGDAHVAMFFQRD
jgi:hypothetical protein